MRKIFESLAWQIFMGLSTIFGIATTIYVLLIPTQDYGLVFTKAYQSSIVRSHSNESDFSMQYKGRYIDIKTHTVSNISLTIFNDGNDPILPSYYDTNIPFQIKVIDGILIDKPTVTSKRNYMQSIIDAYDSTLILLRPKIFESQEIISISMLVLHRKSSVPQIMIEGKIAGHDDFVLNEMSRQEDMESLNIFKIYFKYGIKSFIYTLTSSFLVIFVIIAEIFVFYTVLKLVIDRVGRWRGL